MEQCQTRAHCPHCGFEGAATTAGIHDCRRCRKPLVPVFDRNRLQAWLPAQLGPYRLVAPLGNGGMSCVFEAEDSLQRRRVAIKVPKQQGGWNRSTKDRFDRETRLLQSIRHPNIVQFLDRRKEAGQRCLVMEFVEGEDLGKHLSRHRVQGSCMSFETVWPMFVQLCSALQSLHDQNIVHRDVKPSNIIWQPDGNMKLIDLGIAKDLATNEDETQTGEIAGTWQYLAPEQLRGSPADHRADVYSLGMVIYELLTGELPRGNVKKPSTLNSSVPQVFDEILFRMLEQDPEARPCHIGSLTETNKNAPPPPPTSPGWAVALFILIASIVVLAIGVINSKPLRKSSAEPIERANPIGDAKRRPEAWFEHVGSDPRAPMSESEADEVLWHVLGFRAKAHSPLGLLMEEVRTGGAASRADIRPGDILVKLGGCDVYSKRIEAAFQVRVRPELMSFEVLRGQSAIRGSIRPDRWKQ